MLNELSCYEASLNAEVLRGTSICDTKCRNRGFATLKLRLWR
ncbi:hypothetical protein Z947_2385 [Sulfitobacter geojensis]|nr:hypothetical protein Z947_2385 [Sulfitobacter geojensis]